MRISRGVYSFISRTSDQPGQVGGEGVGGAVAVRGVRGVWWVWEELWWMDVVVVVVFG